MLRNQKTETIQATAISTVSQVRILIADWLNMMSLLKKWAVKKHILVSIFICDAIAILFGFTSGPSCKVDFYRVLPSFYSQFTASARNLGHSVPEWNVRTKKMNALGFGDRPRADDLASDFRIRAITDEMTRFYRFEWNRHVPRRRTNKKSDVATARCSSITDWNGSQYGSIRP